MSAAGQIQEMISNAVDAVTGRYEDRIKALEDRLAALEEQMRPASAKATAAPRRTGKAPSSGA